SKHTAVQLSLAHTWCCCTSSTTQRMRPPARSPRCVSSALARGVLAGPSLLGLIVVAFPSGSTSHALAGATRGGHAVGGPAVVGVNAGLLVAGSVHFGVEPVPKLCVELRGYNAGEGPDENCAFPNGGVNTPSTTGCSSWWDPREAPPKFQQMQRTDDPGGSFAFVTPESGMVLIFAAYAHGGDYPTTVRFLQHRADDGSTGAAAQQHRKHVTPGFESGRLEVRINLSERTDMAELLSWSASARENDHSPCALGKAVGVDDGSVIWGGTRVVPLSTSTSS
ncbi:unnamed protein product, partial [Laminaria digitata]